MNDRAKVKSTLILVSLYLMNQWIRAIHLIASGQFMVYKYCGDMRVSRYIFIGCEYGLDLLSKKYILFNSNEQNAHPLSMHTLLRKAFNLANYRSLTQHTIYTLLYQLYSMSALLQEAALTATTSTTCGSLLPQLQLHLCADGSLLQLLQLLEPRLHPMCSFPREGYLALMMGSAIEHHHGYYQLRAVYIPHPYAWDLESHHTQDPHAPSKSPARGFVKHAAMQTSMEVVFGTRQLGHDDLHRFHKFSSILLYDCPGFQSQYSYGRVRVWSRFCGTLISSFVVSARSLICSWSRGLLGLF